MQRIDGDLVLSPTDLTKHMGCAHITTLDLLSSQGLAQAGTPDDALELIFRLGLAHEDAYLQTLLDEGRTVTTIAAADDTVDRAGRELETLEALQSGVDVVYQGTFFDGRWGGQADFLLRVERPSELGSWSYEIADTKLARKLKVPALLQMATYAERLEVLQGVAPARLSVVTGDGVDHPWRLVDVASYARRARARLREAVEQPSTTVPVPVAQCGQCRWIDRCDDEWRAADDLSLVAFMRGTHRQALIEHGITTLAQLGELSAEELPREIGLASRQRLVHQASLQLSERRTHQVRYDLLEPAPGAGLLRLPRPEEGDVYLDFEGDPYADGGEGREYLAGLGEVGVKADGTGFTAFWAHSPAQEKELTVQLVDDLLQRWQVHPQMHVYHYAPYETSALKKLVARHGIREAELDQLLRGERFVDLYAVVRQGMRISKGSYSIKKMEAFYWGHIRNHNPEVADAMSSVIAYERWTEQPDEVTLPGILDYNRDDVRSTKDLHLWLERCRTELEAVHGAQPRPGEVAADPGRPPSEIELAEIALADQLDAAGEHLLAGLVAFHRREARPAYWEMFRLRDLDDDELVDDSAAIGGLGEPVTVGKVKQSNLYRYEFPAQDTKLKQGDVAYDVDDGSSAGTVDEIDAELGFVVLKRKAQPRLSRGFTEKQVLRDQVIRDAIAAVAQDRLAGVPCLGSALLDRVVPPVLGDLVSAGCALDGQVLAVQGPPGTGKTTQGAEMIRSLLDAGKTVGVTATSHAVITNLLRKVGRPGVQRCDEGVQAPGMVRAVDTDAVVAGLAGGAGLVGGTSWLWCDPRMAGSVDVLVVDEAGQLSLANAVGVSRAARSMVLLGDPQQLAQPTRALHPTGAGVSALGHVLDGHDTIPADRGVFLGLSWRMHPALTAFVSDLAYDGRLTAGLGQEQLRVDSDGPSGSGLRVLEVPHVGNAAASREEVAVVAALWHQLVGGRFTDRHGVQRLMTPSDVLVVTPYNNQVGLLRAALPTARIGTVDKFQGQEAPVVVYSMASSSAQDAPRGVGFLYDLHRLNVAVSRAQAMAVVVLSPALLEAPVHTPEQLRQVNALCRLTELAQSEAHPLNTRGPSGRPT